MEWQGMTLPEDEETFTYNKSSDNAEYLISDFTVDFKVHIQGKTTVHFDIRPRISQDKLYNLNAKYRVW